VIGEGERLYGDGVNIAARLEGLAEPGGICLSGTVYDQVGNKLTLWYEYVGEQEVKNIAKPVRVYRVVMNVAKMDDGGVIGFALIAATWLHIVIFPLLHFLLFTPHSSRRRHSLRHCRCPTNPPSPSCRSPT
jgi:hypothetical protein